MASPAFPSDEVPPITGNFGKVAKRHRLRKKKNQEEVASVAGITVMALHFIETQQRNPTMKSAEGIARGVEEDFAEMVREASLESGQGP